MKKSTKCPICSEISCGDDNHVNSPYIKPENRVGDIGKIFIHQINDMLDIHNMQMADIAGFFVQLLNDHVIEIDDITKKRTRLIVHFVVKSKKVRKKKWKL